MHASPEMVPALPSTMPLWPSRDKVVRSLVLCVLMLNLFDAICTLLWVRMGIAEEANPLLRPLLECSELTFFVVKMSIVCAGLGFLWQQREIPLVKFGLAVATAVYGSLAAYHLDIGMRTMGLGLW